MAYQNVATPRFYVNMVEWGGSIGIYSPFSTFHLWRTLPVSPGGLGADYIKSYDGIPFVKNSFIAHLGHNYKSIDPSGGSSYYILMNYGVQLPLTTVVNSEPTGVEYKHYAPYDGFSIATFNGDGLTDILWTVGNIDVEIGSIVLGTYYDMPQSPNLSLSLSYEYDGIKKITTKGGSDLVHNRYAQAPLWGNLGAWELDNDYFPDLPYPQSLRKSGRRSWDLKFSYMDDGDLWGSNQSLSNLDLSSVFNLSADEINLYDNNDVSSGGNFAFNILTDDNFFSQVWNKTNSGTLPFIFQPDGGVNGNNNPDQFAICKFKNNSLKATQSAFNVYDISLSIEEVW
tara:strand:- start:981 stop:2003 length:1023 start_codon:yes stop_codon:yes gene_type:complete